MSTTTHIFTARCDDCGTEHPLPPEGGMVPGCCDLGDLRRLSLRRDDGEWIAYPNYKRDTVDGPPALLWGQGTDARLERSKAHLGRAFEGHELLPRVRDSRTA